MYQLVHRMVTLFVCVSAGVSALALTLDSPHAKNPRVQFGYRELQRSTQTAGVVRVALVADPHSAGLLTQTGQTLADDPESYVLSIRVPDTRAVIVARDTTGAMYGLLDLAEQVRWRGWQRVESHAKSPYIRLRGVNPFIHVQAFEDQGSWFYDDAFWQMHFDQLARSRTNFFDIHACYDLVTTLFPNIFPYLFYFDDLPDVGVGRAQARRNLDQLKKIVKMADERGIHVGLMTYHAAWSIPGRPGPEPDETRLREYNTRCFEALCREVPGLALVGFRIGESGRSCAFWEQACIEGVTRAGQPDRPIYTRSWVTNRADLEAISRNHKGPVYMEYKYNGEQLGLPYQVTGGWMAGKGSYSYQDYSNFPRPFRTLYQIRANGTHRIFPWGDPTFVARCVKTTRFIDGQGYCVEPLTAYYPLTDYYTNTIYVDNAYSKYLTDRDWYWYELWGRLGYDPDTPDWVWDGLFRDRLGARLGPLTRRLMDCTSAIVPLVYTWRGAGPDHRSIAPEMEWGDDLDTWTRFTPLEVRAFVNADEYADLLLKGEFTARLNPVQVADWLLQAARDARALADQVDAAAPSGPDGREPRYLARCARAQAFLAEYYAHKTQAALWLSLWRRTGAPWYADQLRKAFEQYRDDWKRLSDFTSMGWRPFLEALRRHTEAHHWKNELPRLKADVELVQKVMAEAEAVKTAARTEPAFFPLLTLGTESDGSVVFRAQAIGVIPEAADCRLVWQTTDGRAHAETYFPRPDASGVYTLRFPRELMPAAGSIEYKLRPRGWNARGQFPEAKEAWYRVGTRNTQLTTQLFPAKVDREAGTVVVALRADSPAGIEWVRVWYKAMPSTAQWQSAAMTEGDGRYTAELPYTKEGLQYCFELMDRAGTGSMLPNFRQETPYINVEGW